MNEPGSLPEGFTVDAVDWLPSGARSGLVRVRGHRPPAVSGPLPELILESGSESRRYVSLPDPRADRDPTAWRGAYVLEARPAAEADRMWLEWPGSRRIELQPLAVPEHQVVRAVEAAPEPEPADQGGEVIDRAVLAERRARRAEASEQAQSRISREALRAVEILELRASELEQRALQAEDERDALRAQGPATADPDARLEALSTEIRELRAALVEREAELRRRAFEPDQPASPVRIAPSDAERRAERLRSALTATVATVAELRLRLHELQVARRTRDVAAAADAVRLAVLERERADLQTGLETARAELSAAVRSRDEAAAELDGVRDAHAELRDQFEGVSGELDTAQERITELETEVASLTASAERSSEEISRLRAEALAAEASDDTEAQLTALRARLAGAEAAIADAETAREIAEASALVASTQRRAAEVANAARGRMGPAPLRAVPSEPEPEPEAPAAAPRVPEALIAAAADAERAAAERQRTEETDRVVADLDAAAAALRASEPGADPEPAEPEPEPEFEPEPEPAAVEPEPAAAEPAPAEPEPEPAAEPQPERTRPRIVSATTDPPADLARGRSARDYPPLRGALVKFAHDDPAAAGRLLAGLLKAQHAVLADAPADYDLTITEVGTFAVSAAGQTTLVNALDFPRGRSEAAFHLKTDALTFAETVAGVDARPRRLRGPVRASGKVRTARKLTEEFRTEASLADVVRAGADLDPELVLRGLAYAVRPAWTQGQQWVVELRVEDHPVTLAARHTGGLSVNAGPAETEPDARLRLSSEGFRALLTGDLTDPRIEGDERVLRRLLSLAERARTGSD